MDDNLIKTEPKIEVFEANTSAVNICMLYSFMLKRMTKGYTASEVSFLMGLKEDYMNQKEELKSIEFDVIKMNLFIRTLEYRGLGGVLFTDLGEDRFYDYKMIRTTDTELVQYDLYQIVDDKTEKLFFRLMESNPLSLEKKYSSTHENHIRETSELLKILYQGMFFMSSRTPFEIFIKCRELSGSSLNPKYVKDTLDTMTRAGAKMKLKRVYSKEVGYSYEKSFSKLK
jgi:hypothetical protein